MRKRIITIAALVSALVLASCGGGKSGSNAGGTPTKSEKQVETIKTQTTMKPIALTKQDFLNKVMNFEQNPNEWKYLGDKPCVIDFYASWCGPCKMLAPILDELAEEYADSIYIYKVNTEEEQELSAAFNIRSIPTLLFVPMEGQTQMSQGALPKASLRKAIDEILLAK